MKLQSLTDFVLEIEKEFITPSKPFDKNYHFDSILKYANFLKQPLTLGMFVPCDKENKPLDLIKIENCNCKGFEHYCNDNEKWIQSEAGNCKNLLKGCLFPDNITEAKERVLFKCFEVKGGLSVAKAICQTYQIIDDLTYKKVPLVELELTDSAIKQIGL